MSSSMVDITILGGSNAAYLVRLSLSKARNKTYSYISGSYKEARFSYDNGTSTGVEQNFNTIQLNGLIISETKITKLVNQVFNDIKFALTNNTIYVNISNKTLIITIDFSYVMSVQLSQFRY
ncbi:MAG: hypothetical protein K1060chlam2_01562 [Chlamydiae bacterium]|nr:hypothetical protein [Chlamydiota bacterium]